MAEHTHSTEVPVISDKQKTEELLGTADENVRKLAVENVNKEHDDKSGVTNGNNHELIGGFLTDGSKPLRVEDFKGNEKVCLSSQDDNKTCNNNAHGGGGPNKLKDQCEMVQNGTSNKESEEANASNCQISYNNITTVTEQIPFHPAVNGAIQDTDSTKIRRGISFPQDSVILGYCEPADPWKGGK